MKVEATVLAFVSEGTNRPKRETLLLLAEVLRDLGFEIQHIGRFGVTVIANNDIYARVLGIDATKGLAKAVHVDNKLGLGGLAELIEICPDPIVYAS